eukprot:scaffold500189_cov17-Prasinocladus_malaysianus.AAC.1
MARGPAAVRLPRDGSAFGPQDAGVGSFRTRDAGRARGKWREAQKYHRSTTEEQQKNNRAAGYSRLLKG